MTIRNFAITSLTDKLKGPVFQGKHKKTSADFKRNRKLNSITVAVMILRMIKQSLQIACNWLGDLMKLEPASKQAFSRARQKLSPECFQDLHEDGLKVSYTHAAYNGLWKGFRLIGCDGSTVRFPNSKDLEEKFGRWPTKVGVQESCLIARISEFTDMTNKLVLSGRIAPCNISEEVLAKEQLTEVVHKMRECGQEKLLFVYDRGI